MKKLRVLLADDHPLLREGTARFISSDPEIEVCAAASNGQEALAEAASHHPDVVVFDLHMPDTDGLSVLRQLKTQNPKVELVVYSAGRADDVVEELFATGVRSFVRKTDPSELLITAIKAAGEHKVFLTPAVGEILFSRVMGKPSQADLTTREREVIRLLAEGKSNKEIAKALGISARTAETHRAALMRKLGVSSTAEVVRYAIRSGVIEA